jgi:acyl-CoA synthetase (AMP-forming)/AMP-acid ligase II
MAGTSIDAETLWQLAEARCAVTPEGVFGIDDQGRSWSFSELRARALSVAAALAARGIGPGVPVSWSLPTRLEAAALALGLARLGAVQNPILPINRKREFSFILGQTGARLLVVPDRHRGFDYAGMAEEIRAEGGDFELLVVDGDLPEADPKTLSSGVAALPDAVRWVFYTSGTTAEPKGAQHSDAALIVHAIAMAERQTMGPEDRISLFFPFTHIGGASWLATSLASGATLLFGEAWDPEKTIAFLDREGVTLAGSGTAFHQAYLAAQRVAPERVLFERVRFFPGGAAPKPPQLHEEMKRAFRGAGIVSSYGLTECPVVTVSAPTDPDERLALTEGRASPDTARVRIVTLQGREAATGEEGEVRLKAPQLFKGYVDANLDAAAFDEAGWFRSGDLGRLDEEGFLTITGRLKDVIIRKGENISAKEIEDLLHGHPDVAEAAVVGLPDPALGERCCAVVATEPGRTFSFEAMQTFLRGLDLMTQKIPEQLESVDALPRNAAGKILKRVLVERYGEA